MALGRHAPKRAGMEETDTETESEPSSDNESSTPQVTGGDGEPAPARPRPTDGHSSFIASRADVEAPAGTPSAGLSCSPSTRDPSGVRRVKWPSLSEASGGEAVGMEAMDDGRDIASHDGTGIA